MKILAFTAVGPTDEAKVRPRPQVFPRVFERVRQQAWFEPFDHLHGLGDHGRTPAERVCNKYRRAREIFLAGPWDYLWSVESDMMVPPDALPKLIRAEADIAYGLYCLRRVGYPWNFLQALNEQQAVGDFEQLLVFRRADDARQSWGHIVDVAGAGMGCSLIKRCVLEEIDFRWEGSFTADWWFAKDAQEQGFISRGHMGVICGHCDMEPSPRIIWPDLKDNNLCRIENLQVGTGTKVAV